VGAMTAVVMQVFGDIGKLRKIAEGANYHESFTRRKRIQCLLKLNAVAVILSLAKSDRSASYIFDQLERLLAFLFAQRVAEDAAKQAHIVA
jgi:hypothetical protein